MDDLFIWRKCSAYIKYIYGFDSPLKLYYKCLVDITNVYIITYLMADILKFFANAICVWFQPTKLSFKGRMLGHQIPPQFFQPDIKNEW